MQLTAYLAYCLQPAAKFSSILADFSSSCFLGKRQEVPTLSEGPITWLRFLSVDWERYHSPLWHHKEGDFESLFTLGHFLWKTKTSANSQGQISTARRHIVTEKTDIKKKNNQTKPWSLFSRNWRPLNSFMCWVDYGVRNPQASW